VIPPTDEAATGVRCTLLTLRLPRPAMHGVHTRQFEPAAWGLSDELGPVVVADVPEHNPRREQFGECGDTAQEVTAGRYYVLRTRRSRPLRRLAGGIQSYAAFSSWPASPSHRSTFGRCSGTGATAREGSPGVGRAQRRRVGLQGRNRRCRIWPKECALRVCRAAD
jgi:hypothetical protein